jgi:hypothetical protein
MGQVEIEQKFRKVEACTYGHGRYTYVEEQGFGKAFDVRNKQCDLCEMVSVIEGDMYFYGFMS